MFKELKVDDTVYLVQTDRRHFNPKELKVVKVGRKFVTLENDQRFEEWDSNGFALGVTNDFPRATLYKSRIVYEEMVEWGRFTHLFSGFSKPILNREKRKSILGVYNSDLGEVEE